VEQNLSSDVTANEAVYVVFLIAHNGLAVCDVPPNTNFQNYKQSSTGGMVAKTSVNRI
jgi:hypothetical protein